MGFSYPPAFLFLLLLPLILWALWRGLKHTTAITSLFKSNLPGRPYIVIKLACMTLLVGSLVSAGARPYLEPLSTGDYIFLSDISRSMMARNSCGEPTFLDRSKDIMHNILNDVPEGRFGIMVFARLAFPVTQMTFNHKYLHDVIDNGLHVGMIFEATATSISNSLKQVARKKATFPDLYGNVKYVILFSDGYVEGDWRHEMTLSIAELKQVDIKVITIGIGNPGETPMPKMSGEDCLDEYLQSNGRTLRIPLQDDLLKFVATESGGEYFGEGTVDELTQFIRDQTLSMAAEDTPFTEDQRRDISWIFLLSATIAIFIFLLL
jgi:Ca-activated chloride channel homolog